MKWQVRAMSDNERPITNYYYNCVFGQPFLLKEAPEQGENNSDDIPEEHEKQYRDMINTIAKKLNAVPSLVELIIQEYEDSIQK